ncbi:hypothetical protein PPERSA_10476 [Pseudocohnilembus persalinus]|uniref:Uncharacterized protein n=1 Tax=Pseudocohnilembus persalinus TaxID=266149 RepID=A0A0V0R7B4_PSEPJ|nr:hypothetical protein PPERSA_10476 [Pseudocohnilembus persalinus]|eukprot:KRX10377.1 hypothetical protein PPERSA_10476 [Pseudocohnilembus persalinus]
MGELQTYQDLVQILDKNNNQYENQQFFSLLYVIDRTLQEIYEIFQILSIYKEGLNCIKQVQFSIQKVKENFVQQVFEEKQKKNIMHYLKEIEKKSSKLLLDYTFVLYIQSYRYSTEQYSDTKQIIQYEEKKEIVMDVVRECLDL